MGFGYSFAVCAPGEFGKPTYASGIKVEDFSNSRVKEPVTEKILLCAPTLRELHKVCGSRWSINRVVE
jgi:hypothetical protein